MLAKHWRIDLLLWLSAPPLPPLFCGSGNEGAWLGEAWYTLGQSCLAPSLTRLLPWHFFSFSRPTPRVFCGSGDEGAWLEETWYTLGQFLRKQCPNAEAYVVSGNPTVTKKLFMKASNKWPVSVGGIECRILFYQVLPKREPRSE